MTSGASRNEIGSRGLKPRALVAVVDDHESVRESLPDLLNELGYEARAFPSSEEFLASDCLTDTSACSSTVDAEHSSRTPAAGAVDRLFKPFSEEDLRAALDAALPRN